MNSDSQDGLFDEALVERVELPVDAGVVEAGAGVNKRFRAFEPDAVMLVPPSLDEWLPQNHLARFIADLVAEELDLSRFYGSYAKTKGQPPYDPRLMVRVLLYGYCVGIRSSRELERACVDVVAFRWLAGQQAPDFRSIGRFRKRHLAALGNVFLQALELCRAAGMVSLGKVRPGTQNRGGHSRPPSGTQSREGAVHMPARSLAPSGELVDRHVDLSRVVRRDDHPERRAPAGVCVFGTQGGTWLNPDAAQHLCVLGNDLRIGGHCGPRGYTDGLHLRSVGGEARQGSIGKRLNGSLVHRNSVSTRRQA
jgi:transposase